MKKLEVCPYNKEFACNGIINGLCDANCILHPFYKGDGEVLDLQRHNCPFNKDITCTNDECSNDCYYREEGISDYDDEVISDVEKAFNEGYNLGVKKGYIDCLENKDQDEEEWCECRQLGYSKGLDQGYVNGYREALLGLPCFIEDEEIKLLAKLKKR